MKCDFICLIFSGALLLTIMHALDVGQEFSAVAVVFFDFDDNSSIVNYLVYDDMGSGVRIKYPSNWNMLDKLGNISGNNILVDFYHTGINNTLGYSENANVIVTSIDAMQGKSLDEFTNSTITNLMDTLSNFTLQESASMVISGLPAHKITYTVAGNQSEVKQTQVWTLKDNRIFVVSYSAEPSAYFNPRTSQNILDSLLIRR
ncbi:MAG TPA: DcrB-related protein [Nitrososphaeraceae archaeon]|nr:DcrB-related protein [Nitrososphaeraceae archaeon]